MGDAANAADLQRCPRIPATAGDGRRALASSAPTATTSSIELNGVDRPRFGSRAQIRTAALSLRLAEARLFLADRKTPRCCSSTT